MKHIFYILIFVTMVVFCIICAEADVGLQMGYYNSDDDMSMSLEGSNLNFGSFCSLTPQSIKYNNGGASSQPKAEYSYTLALNGDATYSSAETDSGMFTFSGKVETSGKNDLLRISAKSGVNDGHLNAAYGNDEFKVEEEVETENSAYIQTAVIGPDTVTSLGSGSTLTPVPGLEENLLARSTGEISDAANQTEDEETAEDQGIKYALSVQNVGTGKQGYVDASAMGLTEMQLVTQTKFEDGGYLFGVKMSGIGFAPIDELSMEGQATGLPVQTLPPGEVEISYNETTKSWENESWENETWEGYAELVEEEVGEFNSEHSGYNSTPALWYYLNNEFVNEVPVYVNYTAYYSLDAVEAYELGMVYEIDGK
jgi:hypothetical protein